MDTIVSESVGFNPSLPYFMHIDLNSCFATIEQQANPLLRGKPVAVAAYVTGGGCILAASREAKQSGVKTGMRVREGIALCPRLIVLPSDPNKYRFVHRKLVSLLHSYTPDVEVKSIDEMVVDFRGAMRDLPVRERMTQYAQEIKTRIKNEIGEWLTVSVGISTNRYLAKTASELHKPDGLDVIDAGSIADILSGMKLEELCGIKSGYGGRLRSVGIKSAREFYNAPVRTLKYAFKSVVGYHWWLRLHGWEADDRKFARKSFGQSHALFVPYPRDNPKLDQILCQLVGKMGRRMRRHNFTAGGLHVSCLFSDYSFWHEGHILPHAFFADSDLFAAVRKLLGRAPIKPVRILAVSCFNLLSDTKEQLDFFDTQNRKHALVAALDKICDRWGETTIVPARMLSMERKVLDRIAFGGVEQADEPDSDDGIEHTAFYG